MLGEFVTVSSLCLMTILLFAAKPRPVIVTLAPDCGFLGSIVTPGTTSMVAGAMPLTSLSDLAPTLCWPLTVPGTINLVVKLPVLLGETLVLVKVLSKVSETGSFAGKPVPFNVIVAPGETETGSALRRGMILNWEVYKEPVGSV